MVPGSDLVIAVDRLGKTFWDWVCSWFSGYWVSQCWRLTQSWSSCSESTVRSMDSISARTHDIALSLSKLEYQSVWSLIEQSSSHFRAAWIGEIRLRSAASTLHFYPTTELQTVFDFSRVFRYVLPVSAARMLHLLVKYDDHGAVKDSESLDLADKLFHAVFLETALITSDPRVVRMESFILSHCEFRVCLRVFLIVLGLTFILFRSLVSDCCLQSSVTLVWRWV